MIFHRLTHTVDTFHELRINGQETDRDDDDGPIDYTNGASDAEDTGEPNQPEEPTEGEPPVDDDPGTPADAPEDYTIPDGEEGSGTDTDNTVDAPAPTSDDMGGNPDAGTGGQGDDPGPEGNDGYDDGGGGDDTDYSGGDQGSGDDYGGEGGTTDYTDDGGRGGGDPEGGAQDPESGGGNAGDEPSGGGDSEGDASETSGGADDELTREIQDAEGEIYDDLSDEAKSIRDEELKRNFGELIEAIDNTIERINDISKDTDMLKPMEYVAGQLTDLSERVHDYLVHTFKIKTYTENVVSFRLFLVTLSQINEMLTSIKPSGK